MRVRSFRERTAGERDGDGAATVTTPKRIVITVCKLACPNAFSARTAYGGADHARRGSTSEASGS